MKPYWACTALALLAGPSLAGAAEPARRLNVLVIICDDLNTDLGCYGHPTVRTPHIDRLAARGVRFDRAYCQCPLCTPSRTALLSGRRPETTHVVENVFPPGVYLDNLTGVTFLPKYFGGHGYFVGEKGKVLGYKDPRPVSSRTGRLGSFVPVSFGAGGDGEPTALKGVAVPAVVEWEASDKPDEAQPDGVTARVVAQMMDRNRVRPFFLAAGFTKPHSPFVAPRKYFDLYPAGAIPPLGEPADVLKGYPPAARSQPAIFRPKVPDEVRRQATAAYLACVSFVDAQVGVLLDALDRHKLWDSTVVVFTSDHGHHLGDYGGLWGKRTLFEVSARVPLIVAAPGIRGKGRACPRLVELVDLYPTLAEVCGLPAPDGQEGTSFAPLLDDPGRAWKAAAFTLTTRPPGPGRSVRTERYRYTEWGPDGPAELYDHATDTREFKNLADDPNYAEVRKSLHAALVAGWKAARPAG